jgi:beta-lactam-binding protein with PASTA domain
MKIDSMFVVLVCTMAACLAVFPTALAATVTVPNVVGMNGLDANKVIQKAGLQPQYSMQATPTPDKTKADTIVKQDPASGRSVQAGSVVTLFVYMYQPAEQAKPQPQPQAKPQPQPIQVKVPDVVGKKNTEAYKLLESAGLHHADGVGTLPTYDRSKLYTVAVQNPPVGQSVQPGSVVVLEIINVVYTVPSSAAAKATIPNMYRMDAAQAKQNLGKAGFNKVVILYNVRTNNPADNGKVLRQLPEAGTYFPTAQEIIIYAGVYVK